MPWQKERHLDTLPPGYIKQNLLLQLVWYLKWVSESGYAFVGTSSPQAGHDHTPSKNQTLVYPHCLADPFPVLSEASGENLKEAAEE